MGTVCNNSLASFHSSSNSMTVVFRSDGRVVARGFKAEFISSLPTSSGTVTVYLIVGIRVSSCDLVIKCDEP